MEVERWEGGRGGGRGLCVPWAHNAGGKGGCERKKHLRALEHQKFLSPKNWENHVSHGKGLSKRVECR